MDETVNNFRFFQGNSRSEVAANGSGFLARQGEEPARRGIFVVCCDSGLLVRQLTLTGRPAVSEADGSEDCQMSNMAVEVVFILRRNDHRC